MVLTLSTWIILGKYEKNPGLLPKKVKQVSRNMELYKRDPVISTEEKRNTKILFFFIGTDVVGSSPPFLTKCFFKEKSISPSSYFS